MSAERLEQALCERLPDLVRQVLEERLAALDGDSAEAVDLPGSDDRERERDRTADTGRSALGALAHYLRTGLRPWWANPRDWTALLREAAAALGEPDPVGRLWREVAASAPAEHVLTRMAGPGAWPAIETAVTAALPPQALARLETRSAELGFGPGSGRLLALSLTLLGAPLGAPDLGPMLVRILGRKEARAWLRPSSPVPKKRRPSLPQPLSDALELGLGEDTAGPDPATLAGPDAAPAPARPAEQGKAIRAKQRTESPVSRRDMPTAPVEPRLPADAAAATPAGATPAGANRETGSDTSIAHGQTIVTGSAGAVILQPFLQPLFQALGLATKQGRFVSGGQRRSVALLGFLVWDQALPPDPDLALEKLLCGLDPGQPWPPLEPSDAERKEAGKVLDAVLRHWAALKSTSRDGLRQAFLQRRGQVERDAAGLRLRVEHRDWDLLLDRIPWTIGVVRLPWMAQPLTVDWR